MSNKSNKIQNSYNLDYRKLYKQNIFSTNNMSFPSNSHQNVAITNESNQNPPTYHGLKNEKNDYVQNKIKVAILKMYKIFTMSFIIGFITVITFAVFGILIDIDRKQKLISYDNLIWSVVMQNPEPFNIQNPPSDIMMLKSGIAEVCLYSPSESTSFDQDGRQIISGQEVNDKIYKLFNKKIEINNLTEENKHYLNYDTKYDKFYVEPINSEAYYRPHTIDYKTSDRNAVILTVEYISPKNPTQDNYKDDIGEEIVKTMQYTLKENDISHTKYITEVQLLNQ